MFRRGLALRCSAWMAACAALTACNEREDCPPPQQLMVPTSHVAEDGRTPLDTNGDPDDLESSTFLDLNHDGKFDQSDTVDFDRNGEPDDFNGDGLPDNRFFFDDRAALIPDADSFDDFEDVSLGIPRGMTPVPGGCPADGVATGPLDLLDPQGRPKFTNWKPSSCCRRER
jgi:hypothetical protein